MRDELLPGFAPGEPGGVPVYSNEGELRVITLTEPWATLMLFRAKRIETRHGGFARSYRGGCAIQAARSFPDDERRLCGMKPFYDVLRNRLSERLRLLPDDPKLSRTRIHETLDETLGKILALGTIYSAHATDFLKQQTEAARTTLSPGFYERGRILQPVEREFGNYDDGRLGIFFQKVRPLSEPLAIRGNLGLWTPSPTAAATIRERAVPYEDDALRSMRRASGSTACGICGRVYARHPDEDDLLDASGDPYLQRACDGTLLKL